MNIEKLLKEAYMSGVSESNMARQMSGYSHDFNKMANHYAKTKFKELSIQCVSKCTLCNAEINYKGLCEICYTEQKLNDPD